jgi:hypothetical protein
VSESAPLQPPGKARPTWAWLAVSLAGTSALLAPFALVDVPPVLDYPNHLARFFILAHPDDPILSRMYAVHWAVIPNIGMDLVAQALLRVMPIYPVGSLILALSLLSPIVGVLIYARAAFGRWTWWSLGAGVLAYNGIFFMGFMNFLLSLGVALAGAAAWRVMRRRGLEIRAAVAGAAVGLLAFFCHLFGFAFFALLIAAQEAEALWLMRGGGQQTLTRAGRVSVLLAAALAPALLLYVVTRRSALSGDLLVWRWRAKLVEWLTPGMIYDQATTIVTMAVLTALAVLVWRGSQRAGGATWSMAALAMLYVAAPFAIAGGTYVDTRLPLMVALLLFAGVLPRLSSRMGQAAAAGLTLLAVARVAVVAANWHGHAQDLADLRSGLASVRPGARILPAQTDFPAGAPPSAGRELPNFSRTDDNLAAIAVIERRAFWPLQFADPTQQPMVVRAPYDGLTQALSSPTQWSDLETYPPNPAALVRHRYIANWRSRFDDVLVAGAPPARTPPGLTLLHAGAAVSLYRIDR